MTAHWMRKAIGLAAVFLALATAPGAAAYDPVDVYNDFAKDRVLSCRYSEAELRAALADASLSQYGDPYTLIGLRAAVRKQLAGGCKAAHLSGEGGPSGDEQMLALGAALVAVVGVGGWAARRALTRER